VGADEARAIGWLDGVVDSATLDEHVGAVARRIAAMPPASLAAVKHVVDVSLEAGLHDGLVAESAALARLMADGAHRAPMTKFLATGGQTRDGETERMAAIVDGLLED
jgi:enoyl-CoA hydratase/carnithine racemase